ncbi:helix-turn-helix domain-containing protein [Agrobacterium rubi]|uniref:Helix-turn-helix domain-containing protein n=2 Tax=Agrobacterium rubi TaxID=28099 RepID=A0AAE7UQN5_9HYPH|nr:helix-turn-helix domain-containing protein [Agrobacterium rubi]NTF04129.1 helix-turn-helix domain-containing protein [Agrobacterium rubi]NTF09543.1 helix-turn-helix domain-containing protein [Agrobacterium rubi]NTF22450.1 helix-turn-helix domain-containing protein [Agrobacterium rubi]NTF29307.1 helix-turn-helix domain-containing protein [Agrobacterium rubi]
MSLTEALEMTVWNATELPQKDRFPFWKEVLCQEYVALNSTTEGDAPFFGHVRANLLNSVNITTISSSRQKIHRRRQEISRMPEQVYFLNLQVEGHCRMMQNGREALLQRGDFSIVDSTEPYLNDYCSDIWTQHSFRIPKAILEPLLKQPNRQTATKISSSDPIASLTADYLSSIALNAEHLHATTSSSITNHLVELVAIAVGLSNREVDRARATLRNQLAFSLINYISSHAADPALTPAKAADHFRISVRYVHRLLEDSGETFSKLLLRQRLQKCADDLRAKGNTPVGEIAFRWGFNDLSHFSRSFRNQFGVAPREYRVQYYREADRRPAH